MGFQNKCFRNRDIHTKKTITTFFSIIKPLYHCRAKLSSEEIPSRREVRSKFEEEALGKVGHQEQQDHDDPLQAPGLLLNNTWFQRGEIPGNYILCFPPFSKPFFRCV